MTPVDRLSVTELTKQPTSTEMHIVSILHEAAVVVTAEGLCRKHGISSASRYDLGVNEANIAMLLTGIRPLLSQITDENSPIS